MGLLEVNHYDDIDLCDKSLIINLGISIARGAVAECYKGAYETLL